MDSSDIDLDEDPFLRNVVLRSWPLDTNLVFYFPSKKLLEPLCKKVLNCTKLELFAISDPDLIIMPGTKRRSQQISKLLTTTWSDVSSGTHKLFTINDQSLTTYDGKEIKFVGPRKYMPSGYRVNISVQYINGVVLTNSIVTLLKRELANFDQRTSNPFYISSLEIGSLTQVFLPDIDYLLQLYQELEVSGFDEIPKEVVDMLTLRDSDVNFRFKQTSFFIFTPDGERYDCVDYYFNGKREQIFITRLPEKIVRQARNRIANLRGTMPVQEMSRDVLQKITDGQIIGKDLIRLCISTPAINRVCNSDDQALFKRRLLAEFGPLFKWSDDLVFTTGFMTPRELYVQLHKFYYWVRPANLGDEVDGSIIAQVTDYKGGNRFLKDMASNEAGEFLGKFIVSREELPNVVRFLYIECFDDSRFSFIYVPDTKKMYGAFSVETTASEKEIQALLAKIESIDTAREGVKYSKQRKFNAKIGGENYIFTVYRN